MAPARISAGAIRANFQRTVPISRRRHTAGARLRRPLESLPQHHARLAAPRYRPSEAITREQAVIAYTLTSAYAEFAEKQKGTLEPGKLADLAVLSQDIFTVAPPEMPKTTSVLTLVGGKIAFDSKTIAVN